jgi:hypothetical protein
MTIICSRCHSELKAESQRARTRSHTTTSHHYRYLYTPRLIRTTTIHATPHSSCRSRRTRSQAECVSPACIAQTPRNTALELIKTAFYNDKSTVIQEARAFNESPISPRKCRALLTRIVYLLYAGETFSTQEATTLFFGVTKLFQHKDVSGGSGAGSRICLLLVFG